MLLPDRRIQELHGRLRGRQLSTLLGNLESLQDFIHASGGPLTVGTVCSGTDMPVFVLRRLCAYWLSSHGLEIQIRHAFACEINEPAQDFILRHHEPDFLYKDLLDTRKTCFFFYEIVRASLLTASETRKTCIFYEDVRA